MEKVWQDAHKDIYKMTTEQLFCGFLTRNVSGYMSCLIMIRYTSGHYVTLVLAQSAFQHPSLAVTVSRSLKSSDNDVVRLVEYIRSLQSNGGRGTVTPDALLHLRRWYGLWCCGRKLVQRGTSLRPAGTLQRCTSTPWIQTGLPSTGSPHHQLTVKRSFHDNSTIR